VHPDLLDILACPACRKHHPQIVPVLLLRNQCVQNGRIDSGALHCPNCQATYPIRQAIPRFFDLKTSDKKSVQPTAEPDSRLQQQIAQNFGNAWEIYAETRQNPYTEDQFLDWIEPLGKADFADRWVLDAGCGLAGFAEFAAGYQVQHIVGLELSHAIDAAAPLLAEHPQLSLVQGDLLNPPFRAHAFDLVYSIGVLHHLEKPEAGFQSLLPLVKQPNGQLFFWVYGRENNALVVYGIDPLRRLACRLPVRLVRFLLALPLALVLAALLHTIYHPALDKGWLGRGLEKLPYRRYFQWLRPAGFRYVWGMITDQLIPPRTHYLARKTLQSWLEKAGWQADSLTARNNISWRILASFAHHYEKKHEQKTKPKKLAW
jgi:uncharacterized protein YbaR (Trm112 family)